MTNGTPQPEQTPQDAANETPITFSITIGELNAIFGVINASPFQAVMQDTRDDLMAQVQAQNIPSQGSQAQMLLVTVPLTLKLGEINSIFSIINSSGFVTVMRPLLDKITQQAQLFVTTLNQQQVQQPVNPLGAGMQLPTIELPPTQ